MLLSQKHLNVLQEFCAGKFMVHKTDNICSAMAIDQYHQQTNDITKRSGGAVGPADSSETLNGGLSRSSNEDRRIRG